MKKLQNTIRISGEFIKLLIASLIKHDLASLAAVLSFYAFFSLFPLLLLLIYGVSILMPHTSIQHFIIQAVKLYFPNFSKTNDFISQNITRLAMQNEDLGLVSALTLSWSATSGFIALQQALDVIMDVYIQRSFIVRRLLGLFMLTILLMVAVFGSIILAVWADISMKHSLYSNWILYLQKISQIGLPVTLFLLCYIFYRWIPRKSPESQYLLYGAFLAAIGLDFARQLFVWYASHYFRYEMVYGTTVVMLLLLWMYVANMIVLFGAEISSSLWKINQFTSSKINW